MGSLASRPIAWSADIFAGREGALAGVRVPFDQDTGSRDAESGSKRFKEVETSEIVVIEPCGAAFSAEIPSMNPLRHAM